MYFFFLLLFPKKEAHSYALDSERYIFSAAQGDLPTLFLGSVAGMLQQNPHAKACTVTMDESRGLWQWESWSMNFVLSAETNKIHATNLLSAAL